MAPVNNELCCINCHKPVSSHEARLFAGVFCCLTCYTVAEHLLLQSEMYLRRLMALTKESIRVALIEGKLHHGTDNKELSKRDILEMIVQMSEKKDASKT